MTRQDPLREMIEQMNEMVQTVAGDQAQAAHGLSIDIEQTDDSVIVRADMPGISKDNIQLKLQDNTVHITAETDQELHEEGKDYVRRERSRRQYARQVRLPVAVDETSATATYEDGVLTVEIDRVTNDSGTDIDIE